MDLGIARKVALVHGAGGGLGSAIALALAQEGVRVAACDISESALEGTAVQLTAAQASFVTVPWDLGDHASFEAKLARVNEALGPVDILVNNSGGPPPSLASGLPSQVWEKHFHEMVLSLIRMTDLVLPGMKARQWGRVITSTSSGVIAPIPNLGVSNALRAALVGWSKTLAREVGPSGITANIVLPGRIATQRIASLDAAKAQREGRAVEDVTKESTQSIAVGRYGRPDEYGAAVAFLASRMAAYITGSVLRVDGGLIASV
jgi:3-oxoacyl-[acyl-carrier protein] reductase